MINLIGKNVFYKPRFPARAKPEPAIITEVCNIENGECRITVTAGLKSIKMQYPEAFECFLSTEDTEILLDIQRINQEKATKEKSTGKTTIKSGPPPVIKNHESTEAENRLIKFITSLDEQNNEVPGYQSNQQCFFQQQVTHLGTIETWMAPADYGLVNYPKDIPIIICDTIHHHFRAVSLGHINPRILRNLREQSNYMFTSEQPVDYHNSADAYLLTYLPVNYYKIWKPLYDLAIKSYLPHNCRVLELGAGPGTATMGLISFYSEMAAANPQKRFSLDITAIEKEESFLPILKVLTNQLIKTCTYNLDVSIKPVLADALSFLPEYNQKYDLIIESNMLNSSEGMGEDSFKAFSNVLDKAMNEKAFAIIIEPGTNKDVDYLMALSEYLTSKKTAVCCIQPQKKALDVSGISLYNEACEAGLRTVKKTEHWFSYLVMVRS